MYIYICIYYIYIYVYICIYMYIYYIYIYFEAEHFLFENYSLSFFMLSSKTNMRYSKNVCKTSVSVFNYNKNKAENQTRLTWI